MNIQERSEGDALTLVLDGSFDEMTSPAVEKKIDEAIAGENGIITFDMRNVKYISSAGIRVLILAHKKAMKSGKKIRIGEMSDKVREVIKIVGILPLFSI